MTREQQYEANKDRVIQWVRDTVALMVDNEAAVQIKVVRGQHNVVFEVDCDEADKRHLVGRDGRASEAIRNVLNVICKKTRIKYGFDVV